MEYVDLKTITKYQMFGLYPEDNVDAAVSIFIDNPGFKFGMLNAHILQNGPELDAYRKCLKDMLSDRHQDGTLVAGGRDGVEKNRRAAEFLASVATDPEVPQNDAENMILALIQNPDLFRGMLCAEFESDTEAAYISCIESIGRALGAQHHVFNLGDTKRRKLWNKTASGQENVLDKDRQGSAHE